MKDNEITRLNTALTYAKTAEENRRQMTSHIAHELKTPLAVVHSYAEGLQEHIAEDKRDKYIDVILSETERMDAMVLEMLDLSRLEAGKVKLSRDQFSWGSWQGPSLTGWRGPSPPGTCASPSISRRTPPSPPTRAGSPRWWRTSPPTR